MYITSPAWQDMCCTWLGKASQSASEKGALSALCWGDMGSSSASGAQFLCMCNVAIALQILELQILISSHPQA